jgi:hypothetical protein
MIDFVPQKSGQEANEAKESGKFEKELWYPGEDDVYENPEMDALKL